MAASFPYKTTGQLTYTCKNASDVAVDPDSITVNIFKPDGTDLFGSAQTPTDGAGTGEKIQLISKDEADTIGKWSAVWKWDKDGSETEDIEPFWIDGVVEPVNAVGLCTLEQVQRLPNITTTDDDQRIADLILAATRVICNRYERELVPQVASTVRTFKVTKRHVDLAPYDLRSVTTAKMHPEETSPTTLTAITDYNLQPVGADPLTGTFKDLQLSINVSLSSTLCNNFGYAQLEITGDWGVWATESDVPEDVRQAAITTVLSWLDRPSSEISAINAIGEPGRLPSSGGTWEVPFSAHMIFQRYQRVNWIK